LAEGRRGADEPGGVCADECELDANLPEILFNEQRRDQQFLETAKAKLDWFPVTITFASGYTYRGKGQITDKLEFNSKNSTAEISLKGPANFEQQ